MEITILFELTESQVSTILIAGVALLFGHLYLKFRGRI